MRVLVTGHLGYIGMILVPMLQGYDHEVVGLDTDLYGACPFGDGISAIPSITKDIRDVQPSDLSGFDALIHLAGLSNDPLGDLNPEITYAINYRATLRLAVLAKEVGIQQFIFSSSCSTYGAAGEDLLTEGAPFRPVTPYGHAKVLVERRVVPLGS